MDSGRLVVDHFNGGRGQVYAVLAPGTVKSLARFPRGSRGWSGVASNRVLPAPRGA